MIKPITNFLKLHRNITGLAIGIILFCSELFVYYVTHIIEGYLNIEPTILTGSALDDLIPLCPFFLIFYIYSYFFWITSPMLIIKAGKKHMINFITAYYIGIISGGLILLFYPTQVNRVTEGIYNLNKPGFFWWFLQFVYDADGGEIAWNLIPSFHCLNSVIFYLGVRKQPAISKSEKTYMLVMMILILCSTVLVKQHFLIDVLCGTVLAIIAYIVGMRLDLAEKVFLKKHKAFF